MAKFKDSQGNDLIENKVVISELRKILSSVADLQEDEIIDDNEVAMEQLKAKGYEYSISFPLTFSNFDYQKMQEYGFTDEKLHKELSENVAKNIYDIFKGKEYEEYLNNNVGLFVLNNNLCTEKQ